MKTIVILLCCLFPLLVNAQNHKGINFQTFGSWQDVLKKAKEEHKNIFIDAYATWCGPCKKMDALVYSDTEIGEFVNANFIAVKIQFDQTDKDSEQTKKVYNDAAMLLTKYKIEAYPTFIFLNPNGEMIFRDLGYQNIENFSKIIKAANDSMQNFSGQIQRFKKGKLRGNELLRGALQAKHYNEDSLAIEMAKVYKQTVLDKTEPEKIPSMENLQFFANFSQLIMVSDKVIIYISKNMEHSDSLFGNKGYSNRLVSYLITKDLIFTEIKPDGKYTTQLPKWDKLENRISKYLSRRIAKILLTDAKIGWYKANKDWENVVKYNIEKLDITGIDTVGLAGTFLNNLVFEVIFTYSNKPYALNRGIEYMEILLKNHSDRDTWLDTYANILYKSGKKEKALKYEGKALLIAEGKKDEEAVKIYKEIIHKMKSNQPTWSTD